MGACINNTDIQKPNVARSVSRRTSIEMNIPASNSVMKIRKFEEMKIVGKKRNSVNT